MINKKATKNKNYHNNSKNNKKKIIMSNSIEPQNHPTAKLFSGILCLVSAFAISGVAAFFSVTGLATLFSAAFVSVVVMGIVLESGKLVAASWLHANWKNRRASILLKGYLLFAVFAMMIITGIGIYGYLSKAYLDQSAPAGVVDVQISAYQQQIAQDNSNISRLNSEQNQMDAQINSLITQNKVYQSQIIRKSQQSERNDVKKEIDSAEQDLISLNQKIEPLQIQANGTDEKLGPIKYVAALIGWKDLDSAVRLVILIIMFAFDPLAVVLLLSGTISIGEWLDTRQTKKIQVIEKKIEKEIVVETPKIEPIVEPIFVEEKIFEQPIETPKIIIPIPVMEPEVVRLVDAEAEHFVQPPIVTQKQDTAKLLIQLLEKNPEIMQEVIDVVSEFNEREKQKNE